MAQFKRAYEFTSEQEGGYANNPADRGGETYAGISRVHNPTWPGWRIVDRHKPLNWNERIWDQELIGMVEGFYQDRFNRIKADQLNSQAIANLFFDFHVHSGGRAVLELQRAINDLSFPHLIAVDGIMGPQTINAANGLDVAKLHDRYKTRRKEFLTAIIENNPSQEVFRAGWLARIAQFPNLLEKKKT